MPRKLTDILKVNPTTKTYTLDQKGQFQPHEREVAAKADLKKHVVKDNGYPFDNERTFTAADVKVYDRAANRHGKPNVNYNDVNDKYGLKTSTISTEEQEWLNEVFDAYFQENPDASFAQAYKDIMEAVDELDEEQIEERVDPHTARVWRKKLNKDNALKNARRNIARRDRKEKGYAVGGRKEEK